MHFIISLFRPVSLTWHSKIPYKTSKQVYTEQKFTYRICNEAQEVASYITICISVLIAWSSLNEHIQELYLSLRDETNLKFSCLLWGIRKHSDCCNVTKKFCFNRKMLINQNVKNTCYSTASDILMTKTHTDSTLLTFAKRETWQ